MLCVFNLVPEERGQTLREEFITIILQCNGYSGPITQGPILYSSDNNEFGLLVLLMDYVLFVGGGRHSHDIVGYAFILLLPTLGSCYC